jgi:hypothetical protein
LQLSVVHGLLSLQLSAVPLRQTPAWQVSAPLHALPSPHDAPFARAVWVQPNVALQPSVVHGLLSLQSRAAPALQVPAWQVSAPLQTLPSPHGTPFATAGCWQPATGSQLSVVQALLSLQLSDVPAVHAPAWQVSAPLHTLPSAHEVPFGNGVFTHAPALHVSKVHGFESAQSAFTVHWMQPLTGVCTHPDTGLQVSVVQPFPSLQLSGDPGSQTPP